MCNTLLKEITVSHVFQHLNRKKKINNNTSTSVRLMSAYGIFAQLCIKLYQTIEADFH